MNSRRKFLAQGGLAATALIAVNPYKTVAGVNSQSLGFNSNKILFLHTADNNNTDHILEDHANALNRTTGNVILLNAGKEAVAALANDYKIVYKGDIKIGVITADASGSDGFNKINSLALDLKKEKNCHLVVCLSQLGYKNKHNLDDINLAAQSSNIDIIIGGNAGNGTKYPVIALNKEKAEVIIDHAVDPSLDMRKIEITFNDRAQKRNIDLN
jgi:hypothetical protein